jgi:hypothetical protein
VCSGLRQHAEEAGVLSGACEEARVPNVGGRGVAGCGWEAGVGSGYERCEVEDGARWLISLLVRSGVVTTKWCGVAGRCGLGGGWLLRSWVAERAGGKKKGYSDC